MKTLGQRKRFVLLVIFFAGLFAGLSDVVWAQSARSDYEYLPPFLGVDAKPNILFLLDNSGSMNSCAYANSEQLGATDCSGVENEKPEKAKDYNNQKSHSGYFEVGKCYAYDTTQRKFISPQAKGTALSCTDTLAPWDGNFLNWLTMRRIDIAKWALTGGQCDRTGGRIDENTCGTLRGQTESTARWALYKQADLSGVKPFDGVRCILIHRGDFFILKNIICGGDEVVSLIGASSKDEDQAKSAVAREQAKKDGSGFEIRVVAVAKPIGVIQTVGGSARFGLMVFNANDQGGRIAADVGSSVLGLVKEIEKTAANTNTPLAESLYQATRYFAQIKPAYSDDNYTVGVNHDPYCFGDLTPPKGRKGCRNNDTGEWVGCCKSFVLIFTDGEPTQDLDIPNTLQDTTLSHAAANHDTTINGTKHHDRVRPALKGSHYLDDVAYFAHTTDLRPDKRDNIATLNATSTPNETFDSNGKLIGLPKTQNLTIYTFNAFGSEESNASILLKETAKVGAFKDANDNNLPDLTSEWDIKDNKTGALAPDGIPDAYFSAEDAESMRKNLLAAFNAMMKSSSSGTAVSFLATSSTGEGAIYQSYFFASTLDAVPVSWVGYVQALFLDNAGGIREDSNHDGRLVLTEDKIVKTSFNKDKEKTEVWLCEPDKTTGKNTGNCGEPLERGLEEINPIWEGGGLLAKRDASDRNIKTWVDGISSPNNVVDDSEVIDFSSVNAGTLRPYLRAENNGTSTDIINFIRGGANIKNYRNRQRTVDNATTTWKLGDILNSDPVSVGAPAEAIDKKFGDTSYTRFFEKYKDRRHVVYVGANDGMLHAFNGGFFHRGDDKTSTSTTARVFFTKNNKDSTGEKPLGEELWGFIPQELLPHLRWLTEAGYDRDGHLFFVDGSPRITDAKIFNQDDVHPNGWGTILIASMRMGGGLLPVDLNGNGTTTDLGEDRFRSAYFAFDITDPEAPFGSDGNKLLWVFKDKDLGFTTSFPAIMRLDATTWYAIFGSGPLSYNGKRDQVSIRNKFESTASEYGHVYVVNLKDGALAMKKQLDDKDRYAFMGDPTALDLDLDFDSRGNRDYITDSVYIGSTFGVSGNWRGKMHRILTYEETDPKKWAYSVLFDPEKPILAAPTVTQDKLKRPWVYFGTGRLFSSGTDSDQHDVSQQALYGIKEGGPNGCWDTGKQGWKDTCKTTSLPILVTDLLTTNDISVQKEGNCTGTGCGEGKTIFDLANDVVNSTSTPKEGWVLNLGTNGERMIKKVTLLAGIVAVPSYTPSLEEGVCATFGNSTLYATYYETGTAFASRNNTNGVFASLGAGGNDSGLDASGNVRVTKDLGFGIASRVAMVANEDNVTGFTQTSTGEIVKLVLNLTPRPEGARLFLEKTE